MPWYALKDSDDGGTWGIGGMTTCEVGMGIIMPLLRMTICSTNQAACLLVQALFCLDQPPSQLSFLQAASVRPSSHSAALPTSPSW